MLERMRDFEFRKQENVPSSRIVQSNGFHLLPLETGGSVDYVRETKGEKGRGRRERRGGGRRERRGGGGGKKNKEEGREGELLKMRIRNKRKKRYFNPKI